MPEANTPMIRKLKAGKYIVPAEFIPIPGTNRDYLKFPYNKVLIEEIKNLEGAKWHGYDDKPVKMWSIPLTARNQFSLDYLDRDCVSPYAVYDTPLVPITTTRPLYKHQHEMVGHILARHYVIVAAEMGTGKTLAAIEAIENAEIRGNIWYVGPKSGVKAVELELSKWSAKITPVMYTYERLVRAMREFKQDDTPPQVVIFDESSKIKTPQAQRSQAALFLRNLVSAYWKHEGFVILMSGTPAPRSPSDWYNQCEVACPGFIREGNIHKFKARLCIIEERESLSGGRFPHIVTWRDDEKKCDVCGMLEEHADHSLFVTPEAEQYEGENELTRAIRRSPTKMTPEQLQILAKDLGLSHKLQYVNQNFHPYKKSRNEVSYLYERLKGLVLVQFKKDCLDLPEKQYRIIKVKPTVDIIRAAGLIKARSARVVTALTLMRELSDGFQYSMSEDGEETCSNCNGSGKAARMVPLQPVDPLLPLDVKPEDFKSEIDVCELCDGTGKVPHMARSTNALSVCPKDEPFIELLDDHEDIGRFIVWAGFTGSIDRLVQICHKEEWATLRVDGRGYIGQDAKGQPIDANELLVAMDYSHPRKQELLDKYPKLCFVGHPEAGGMALTLTASPTALYYSNSFKGEARMQSEDRGHRMGMDMNRGFTIIDLIHLPTDQVVLDNIMKKKKLQSLSMGELSEAIEKVQNG